jgi:hypothetical protein
MPSRKQIEAAAERLRRESDALFVLVVKPEWGYFARDPKLAPRDAIHELEEELPRVRAFLAAQGGRR